MPTKKAPLTDSLNQVLADSYATLSLTHLAHWNVEGPGFFALHTAFQTQVDQDGLQQGSRRRAGGIGCRCHATADSKARQ